MISIDLSDVRQWEKDLLFVRDRAIPFATKSAINTAAWNTRKEARQIIERDMTTRNQWTVRSVQVDEARTLNIRNQEAIVGSIADYMATQEFGGTKTDPTITTGYAAGQEGAKPRTRVARSANQVRNIRLKGNRVGSGGRSRGQQNFVTVRRAAKQGVRYVYLKGKDFEGLFRLIGGRKNPEIRMVHDLSRKSVDIPRSPWLKPATDIVTPQLDRFYADALRFQLKRLGRFIN